MQSNIPKLRFPEFSGGWGTKKLGDLFVIKSASRVHKDEWTMSGVPFYRSSDVVAQFKGEGNEKAYISESLFEKLCIKTGKPEEGDILVTGGGSVGIPYLVSSNLPLYFKDADLLWIKRSNKFVSSFLFIFLTAPTFRRYLTNVSHAGTIGHYTIEQAKATPITFPGLGEQAKIAEFLTVVDERVAAMSKKVELLQQYKRGVMQKIFSQKLRFKDENGQSYPDWQEKKLGEVFSFLRTNSLSRAELTNEGSVMNIHYGDIHTKLGPTFDASLAETSYIIGDHISDLCEDGDLVIADASEDRQDVGKSTEIVNTDGKTIVAGLHTFLARPTNMAIGFAGYFMQCDEIKRQLWRIATGASVLGISKNQLSMLNANLPNKDEQQKIASFLASLDDKINLEKTKLEQAKLFKKSLLQRMFV